MTIKFVVDSPAAPISLSEYSDYIPTKSLMSYSSSVSNGNADAVNQLFDTKYWSMTTESSD